MKRSSKILITVAAVVGISAASLSWVSANGGWGPGCGAYNQGYGHGQMMRHGGFQGMGPGAMQGGPGFGRGMGPGFMQGGPGFGMEQRLETIKSQLQITDQQEPAWQAFEQAMSKNMAAMGEKFQGRGFMGQMPVEDRIKFMREKAGHMSEMAGVIENLYAELTPEQQKLADQLHPMRRMR